MGVPTSVSIGSMVNLPPTARSEDYVGACNCKYLSREKPRNHYIFARGVWGDVCASRRGVVFLLHLALIDCVKDSMPKAKTKNQNISVCGALRDVCTSFGRGMAFLLHLALIAIISIPLLHLQKVPCGLMYGLIFLTCASAHRAEPCRGPCEVQCSPLDWFNVSTHTVRMSLEMNTGVGKSISPPTCTTKSWSAQTLRLTNSLNHRFLLTERSFCADTRAGMTRAH